MIRNLMVGGGWVAPDANSDKSAPLELFDRIQIEHLLPPLSVSIYPPR